jgi:hypothetical protein
MIGQLSIMLCLVGNEEDIIGFLMDWVKAYNICFATSLILDALAKHQSQ